jgi:hypothetical protein
MSALRTVTVGMRGSERSARCMSDLRCDFGDLLFVMKLCDEHVSASFLCHCGGH